MWISVEESLPKEGDEVLCAWANTEEQHVLRHYRQDDVWSRAMDNDKWEAPTHWQPLPEPPQDKPDD